MSKVEKKRANIYVDSNKYDRLKRVLDVMGVTVTEFFDEAMTDFLNNMEEAVLKQDSEIFLQMMAKNLEYIQEQVAKELKK